MMAEAEKSKEINYLRKLVVPLIAGGIAGIVSSMGVMAVMDGALGDDVSPSRMIAAVVGAVYVVIAIGVGVGAASPALGEKYLNTEDADEIREMRSMLMSSACAMTLWGVALIVLAMAAPEGPIAAEIALAVSIVTLLTGGWFAWRAHKASDELFASLNLESTAWAYSFTALIGGGWMVGAHLEMIPALAPLDWLSLIYIVALVSSFIGAGRRGMLKVR